MMGDTNNILLIGATGLIGSHLTTALRPDHDAGTARVRVTARSDASRAKVEAMGLEPLAFDLEKYEDFDKAFVGIDTIFLLRPYTIRYMMQNKQVVDAAKRAGVSHIVTLSAYAREDTPFAVMGWQIIVDDYIANSGLGWTHLRPNFIMDNMIAQRDPASATIFNRLTRPVSWLSSDDIADVGAAVLRNPSAHNGKAYPLAAEATSLPEIADHFTAITGVPHKHVVPPVEHVMNRLLAQGREPIYAEALVDYVTAINDGRVPEIADTFDTVEQILGRPHLDWPTFLKKRLG
jgi:uncharacterized protein YbjT (DUF2867 family)